MKLASLAVLAFVTATTVVAQDTAPRPAREPTKSSAANRDLQIAVDLESSAKQLTATGNHSAALQLRIRALAIHEDVFGMGDPNTAGAINNLALTYAALAQHDKALTLYIRALAIYVEGLGWEHLHTATVLNNLALAYSALAQYSKALDLEILALQIREKTLGPDHPDTAQSMGNLARTYSILGQHDKTLALELRALAIYEKRLGPEHPDTARGLDNLSATYSARGEHDKALPLQMRALVIREKVYGPEHPDTARSLNNVAEIYSSLAQHDRALHFKLRALAIFEKVLGLDHPDTALSLNNLASTYANLAQYDKALALDLRALAIYEKTLGPEHPDTARALNNLAQTHSKLAQLDKALPLQERALSIYEKVLGPEHPDTATSLNNLAATYADIAQHDKALQFRVRALAIREKALGPEHPDTAQSLQNLAQSHSMLGQYEKALPLKTRALSIAEKVLGPEHPDVATNLNNLAQTYLALGQYDKALPLFMRAHAIYGKTLGLEHPDTATSLSNLAQTYSALAQHDKALSLQLQAHAIFEKLFGPEHPYIALSLNNLAEAYANVAQLDKALAFQMQALSIREKALGPEHPDTATSLNNLAEIYSELAQHDKALPLKIRALEIFEKVLGAEHPDTATSLNNLAGTYADIAQHDKALPLRLRALAIREKVLGPEHESTGQSLRFLAYDMYRHNQKSAAIALVKRAINITQAQRELVARIDRSSERTYTQSLDFVYQTLAQWLVDEGRLAEAEQVLDMLKESERFAFIRRSGTVDPRKTRAGYTAREKAILDRYGQIAGRLSALGAEAQALERKSKIGLTPEEQRRRAALAADLKVAEAVFTAFLQEMHKEFAAQGTAREADIAETSVENLRRLQQTIRALGDDVVRVRYFATDERVTMLVMTSRDQWERHSLVKRSELNGRILEFRRLLRDPGADFRAAAQDLYRVLVAPIAADLEQANARTVMLSLDGQLRYLPFGALHDGARHLVERWQLPIYDESARATLRQTASRGFKVAGLGVTRGFGEFKPLPAVRSELDSILRAGNREASSGELYLDEQFTEGRLRDVTQRPIQLVHIASHFRFSPSSEIHSFLLLGDGRQLTLGDIRTGGWSFANIDLLTLSACDTGLGGGRDPKNGREIDGFGWIAQQQGAKGVLATLWPVADRSTAIFMGELYQRLQDSRLTKAESLRQTQLALLNGKHPRIQTAPQKMTPGIPGVPAYVPDPDRPYAHPYYWAPFILMGNWL